MQILGLCVLVVVVAYGFTERDMNQISVFDSHALVVVLFDQLHGQKHHADIRMSS